MMNRDDDALPTVMAIATAPIVLADGKLMAAEDEFNRDFGIHFKIQREVMALLPNPAECTAEAARKAMKFLVDEWLCDVATDNTGKYVLVAAALSIIERSLLPERPVFFVTAGRSKAGKTTTLTDADHGGDRPTPRGVGVVRCNEEERRKSLLSYFLHGVPYILWDNIPKGRQIACPHIEKSCTRGFYADRKLGVSEMVMTAASLIHLFTGSNIGPRGDLATRSLECRLDVDRADPENRDFKHPDPVDWTEAHRAKILRAFYVILLGNPQLQKPLDAAARRASKCGGAWSGQPSSTPRTTRW